MKVCCSTSEASEDEEAFAFEAPKTASATLDVTPPNKNPTSRFEFRDFFVLWFIVVFAQSDSWNAQDE